MNQPKIYQPKIDGLVKLGNGKGLTVALGFEKAAKLSQKDTATSLRRHALHKNASQMQRCISETSISHRSISPFRC